LEASRLVRATGREEQFEEMNASLRDWAAYNGAVGELAADLSMRPRVEAHRILADALLAFVAGPDLGTNARDALLASWVSTRPDRFVGGR
jgi:hypothetical protein